MSTFPLIIDVIIWSCVDPRDILLNINETNIGKKKVFHAVELITCYYSPLVSN